MSFAVDTDVLLQASDTGAPRHHAALDFLQARARGPELFCVPWLTLTNYLRIATHPGVFSRPLAPVGEYRFITRSAQCPRSRRGGPVLGMLRGSDSWCGRPGKLGAGFPPGGYLA